LGNDTDHIEVHAKISFRVLCLLLDGETLNISFL